MSVSPQLKKKKDVKLIRWKGTSESIKETKGARGTLSRSRATSGTERAGYSVRDKWACPTHLSHTNS